MAASYYFLLISTIFVIIAARVSTQNITEILTVPAPSASDVNITTLLKNAGCKTFASLLQTTSVLKTYLSVVDKGLTIFAPSDEAFKANGLLDLAKLASADAKSLLLFHALPSYKPYDSLKASKAPISTLASNGARKFELTTITAGDKVTLDTGVGLSRIANTILDATPLVIFLIDSVLLPEELFGKSPSPALAPSASNVNITALLENANCKTFVSLLQVSGVLKTYLSAVDKGLTIFAPNDEAFKAKGLPDLEKLNKADTVSLLQFHGLLSYKPSASLKASESPISTLASNGTRKFELTTTIAGDEITLDTGVDSSRIASTILDATPLVIFSIDSVLLPEELFGNSPSPAPAPSASNVNITALLENANCKTFVSLLQVSGVLETYLSAVDKGLTIFAPNDEAFKAKGLPDLAKLKKFDTVSLLLFHGLPSYKPFASLKASESPISTLASNGTRKFELTTTTAGNEITLNTGVDSSRIASTILDATPLVIFSIDSVLLPEELFGNSPYPVPTPSTSNVNITALLENANCKTLVSLLQVSGVLKTYLSAVDKGLTIFAPNDEAFKAKGLPNLAKLNKADTASLLLFHGLPSYKPFDSLKASVAPISTLASNGTRKFELMTTTAGDEITLDTGVDSSRIANTILDATPLVIFSIDSVLLPRELFGKSLSPAQAPEPAAALSPSPLSIPSPAPSKVEAPSPLAASPPSPPIETPKDAPTNVPGSASDSSTTDNAAVHMSIGSGASLTLIVVVTISLGFIVIA